MQVKQVDGHLLRIRRMVQYIARRMLYCVTLMRARRRGYTLISGSPLDAASTNITTL
jgi:hypothetical protein